MAGELCKYHEDHSSRIRRLEAEVKDLRDSRMNPGIWLGLFSLLGVIFSSIGSAIGAVVSAYVGR